MNHDYLIMSLRRIKKISPFEYTCICQNVRHSLSENMWIKDISKLVPLRPYSFFSWRKQFYGISLMTFISQLKMSFVSRNEALLQELEICFQLVITTQIRSLFLRSETSFLESKLCFWIQTFVPGIETSFPQLKLRFSEQRFELSCNKQFETNKLRM